jgi:hypothetical protein
MDDEDEILVAELGKLGATGGRKGAALADLLGLPSSEASAKGGARGAKRAGRRLSKNIHEIEITLAAPCDEVFIRVVSLLESLGRIVAQTGPEDGKAIVRGVLGAGTMNRNPAVVTVTMSATDRNSTAVRIRGAAKEGLIKQHAGEKAAKRLAADLG